jgi:hypothetical protein
MNKWFESNNLASYAKTALIEAQKRIDKVLDINEAEAMASGGAGANLSSSSSSNLGGLAAASTAASFAGMASNAFDSLLAKGRLTSRSNSSSTFCKPNRCKPVDL